ncbi:sodium-dependent bicarbonate transport family permease [candidate division WOR-3 bacterium]|nr:sodium-dependent bicarbonate transport family permease [candidate division WOR-3 bacterium]
MELLHSILIQILSPPILFFALGIFAALVKSDLKIPEAMSTAMTIFLLCAIGLEGGIGIAKAGIGDVLAPALAAIVLGVGITLLGYTILTRLKFDVANAGGIAGHYGAVSSATMLLGFAYLDRLNVPYEAFVPTLYPLMDSPAILTGILLARIALAKQKGATTRVSVSKILKESVLGKAVLLLIASLVIGYIGGVEGTSGIMPFFDGMFKGVLCLFMLDMGLVAAARLTEWKVVGYKLAAYAFIMPPIHGIVGVLLGTWVGLSVGGATMLGIIAGSASYISAPAAMRAAVPDANPSLSLTASVALTFPFNILIGIPLYYTVARMLG